MKYETYLEFCEPQIIVSSDLVEVNAVLHIKIKIQRQCFQQPSPAIAIGARTVSQKGSRSVGPVRASLQLWFARWEGEQRSVGSMRGRDQIHVLLSNRCFSPSSSSSSFF